MNGRNNDTKVSDSALRIDARPPPPPDLLSRAAVRCRASLDGRLPTSVGRRWCVHVLVRSDIDNVLIVTNRLRVPTDTRAQRALGQHPDASKSHSDIHRRWALTWTTRQCHNSPIASLARFTAHKDSALHSQIDVSRMIAGPTYRL